MKNVYMTPTERINQLARELLTAMTEQQEAQSRADKLAYQYGEACKISVAMKIIGCGRERVKAMLEDGRIKYACEGEMVDVRSIAEYIEMPKRYDSTARAKKKYGNDGDSCQWRV